MAQSRRRINLNQKRFERYLQKYSPSLYGVFKKFEIMRRQLAGSSIDKKKKYVIIAQALNNDLREFLFGLIELTQKIPQYVWNYLQNLCTQTANQINPNIPGVLAIRSSIRMRVHTVRRYTTWCKKIDFFAL